MASTRKMERLYERAMSVEFKSRWDLHKRERVRRERLWEAMRVAQELRDLRFQGGILRELASSHWRLMDDAKVVELMEADIDLAVRAEDLDWEFHSHVSLALYFARRDLEPEDRRALVVLLHRAWEIADALGQREWQLVAAALMAHFARGLTEESEALEAFAEALEGIDLEAWSRDDEPHAVFAERLAALEPSREAIDTVVASITLGSGYGDMEEEANEVGYVHHRSFRQRLRLEPRESETT